MAERTVDVSGSGLDFIVGMLVAAILLLTVLFSLVVFDGKQGADGNTEAPKMEAPKVD